MQIRDLKSMTNLRLVELRLTIAEAQELRDNLDVLLTSPVGRHEHVSSLDYQTELKVLIENLEHTP